VQHQGSNDGQEQGALRTGRFFCQLTLQLGNLEKQGVL
jgi:hypothetical protein